jgi:hypothetical protein
MGRRKTWRRVHITTIDGQTVEWKYRARNGAEWIVIRDENDKRTTVHASAIHECSPTYIEDNRCHGSHHVLPSEIKAYIEEKLVKQK